MDRLNRLYNDKLLRLYYKVTKWDLIFILPFVYLSLKIRLQYLNFLLSSGGPGLPTSADSKWYLNYAYNLLQHKEIGHSMNDIMYLGYNLVLTALLAVFKSETAVVFAQSITAGLCVILVYKICHMLFNRLTAIIASYFYCYHTWDITLWATYILSDSFFISLLLLCVYLLLKFMQTNKSVYKISFIVCTFYLLIFRPTGIVTVLFILVYLLLNSDRKKLLAWMSKYRLALGASFTALAAIVIAAYFGHKFDPLISSIQYNAKLVLYNVYAKGWIFDQPSPKDHHYTPDYTINVMNSLVVSFIVNNWDHVAIIYIKRAIGFFGRWAWHTDLTNTAGIKAFAENMIPAVLFGIGTLAAFFTGVFRRASIIWFVVLTVFIFCIVVFIDGMYRYKAPGIPFIGIIAAYGVERVIFMLVYAVKYVAKKLLALRRNRLPSSPAYERTTSVSEL